MDLILILHTASIFNVIANKSMRGRVENCLEAETLGGDNSVISGHKSLKFWV